ncbi:sensor histidine kinase [Actinoplanes aureus]|jgi:signal transduction histidine kinase|uniref:histidine kinase n=1 Tax=Actinoplanes aureus TaxID=2792083 RepID=A0A931C487_9ACTN|nr:histidine kinase [Actinoplanes aureus]MBG0560153.1 sensor histidine kinase [Actinoplanes aureus]
MRRWMTDVGPAVLAFALATARVAVAPVLPADRAPDTLAYALVAAMALALLLRRRLPALTLAAVGALFITYHVLRYPGGAPAVPVWIALYSVAVAPHRRLGLTFAGALVLLDAHSRMAVSGVGPLDATLDGSTGIFLAALLLGEVVRGRRARLAMADAEREHQLTQERIRIARELHDVTAHTLAVVAVQAGVAAEIQRDDPEGARAALETVRQAARDAMAELRAAVGVLRDGSREQPLTDRPAAPAPTLDRLPELVADTGAVLIREGSPRRLPRAVEATAYRILQEAVANAVRHSGAGHIEVRVGYQPDGLSLAVDDDGRGGGGPPGNGLRGMVERARGLGGWLRAGPRGEGGFEVRGWLPG